MKKPNPLVAEQGGALGYMPQLDALRAFAVGLVFISHWADPTGVTGMLGVRLFFVLSGFLITSILLKIRMEVDADGTPSIVQLRLFYARRFLRLFPALLLLIVVLIVFDWGSIRHTWGWHITYLSNIYFGLRNDLDGPISPLWSLSVEEQFYLVWPLVILIAPKRTHLTAVLSLIGFALLWEIGMWKTGIHTQWAYVLPPKWLDGLGFGSLLAVLNHAGRQHEAVELVMVGRNVALPALLALLIARLFGSFAGVTSVLLDFVASVAFVWIVAGAAQSFDGRVGRILQWRPLLYLGQISYGLYLYHAFVPDSFKFVMKQLRVPLTSWDVPLPLFNAASFISPTLATKLTAAVMLVIYSLLSIMLASVSWFAWERPINGLRRHIRYRRVETRSSVPPRSAETC